MSRAMDRVRQLEQDLSTLIVIGEKEEERWVVDGTHWEIEEVWAANRGVGDRYVEVEDGHTEIVKVPIYGGPDLAKRGKAAIELQMMYDNSKWYQFLLRRRINQILDRKL
jgi:hypothetical protein